VGNFLTNYVTINFSRGTLFHAASSQHLVNSKNYDASQYVIFSILLLFLSQVKIHHSAQYIQFYGLLYYHIGCVSVHFLLQASVLAPEFAGAK
jgi:hypothetical protein